MIYAFMHREVEFNLKWMSYAGVTILLSMTIFLNTVQVIIPITSESPLIGKFYLFYLGCCRKWDKFSSHNITENFY